MKTSPLVNCSGLVSLRSALRRSRTLRRGALCLGLLMGGVASAQDQNVNGAVNYTASLAVTSGQTVKIATGSAFNATYALRATATGYSDAIIFSVIAQKGGGPAYVTVLSQKVVGGTMLLYNPRVLESGSGTSMHLVITVNVPASVTLVAGATGTQTNLDLSTTLPTFDSPAPTTVSNVLNSYTGSLGVGTAYPATTLQLVAGGNAFGAGAELGLGANYDRAPMFSIKGALIGTGSGGDSGDVYFNLRSADNVALAPVMTLLRGGNVGIGGTPTTKLHVSGAASGGQVTARVENTSAGTTGLAGVQFKTSAASSVWQTFARGGDFFLGVDGVADYLTVKSGGNVGIGTSSAPGAKLEVYDSTSDTRIGNLGSGDYAGISFNGTLSFGSYNLASGIGDKDLLVNRPTGRAIQFRENNGTAQMILASGGNVGIGITTSTYMTSSNGTPYKLSVEGKIHAKEVVVDSDSASWADYVFATGYRNAPLTEVEQHIKDHGHLPGIPSAKEVGEKGVNVGQMQSLLLSKIEELTLHLIEQEKHAKTQESHLREQRERLIEQDKRLARLEQENAALRATR